MNARTAALICRLLGKTRWTPARSTTNGSSTGTRRPALTSGIAKPSGTCAIPRPATAATIASDMTLTARRPATGTVSGPSGLLNVQLAPSVESPYIIVYEVHDDREEIEVLSI